MFWVILAEHISAVMIHFCTFFTFGVCYLSLANVHITHNFDIMFTKTDLHQTCCHQLLPACVENNRRAIRWLLLFFKEHVQNINEAIVSFKRRTNLLREHKRNLLLKKDLFYGRTQSEL